MNVPFIILYMLISLENVKIDTIKVMLKKSYYIIAKNEWISHKGRIHMELVTQMKLVGDAYAGGFSCGLTMSGSQTMEKFSKCKDSDEESVYKNEEGIELVLKKEKDGQVTRVHTQLINGSSKKITVEMLASFGIKGIVADKIHRLQSFWSAEGKLRTESIYDLHLEPSWNRCGLRVEKFGNIGSMPVRKYFPFLALEDSKTGEVVGVQLYGASSWQIEILCKEDDTLSVFGGLPDQDFGQWSKNLLPGEYFETPQALIARGNSLYEVCDKLVKAQKPHISPIDSQMGIMFNEYCTTWGNPSYENMKKICDKIAGKGIQYLVIDSGWYGKNDNWWDSIGDWEVNEEKFPGGMKPIADYIRSKGMIPGLWFEMESLAHGSRYYEASEHLVKRNGVPLTVGGRRFWDMEDPWVVDYLSEKVIKQLKDSGFGYLKVDYNDSMGMGCDDPEGLGEGLRKKVRASQRFFEKIREEMPDIVIENCSSGGHRLEPSMMALASQASFSDAHEITSIPLIAANMHRVILPAQSQIWAVMRAKDIDERIFYSIISTFFGRMCLSGDIYDLSEHQWTLIEEGMAFYKKAANIIEKGTTILQKYCTESYNRPTGNQLVIRQWKNDYLVIVHRFEDSKEPDLEFLKGKEILAEYGKAEEDFSAKAWICRQ